VDVDGGDRVTLGAYYGDLPIELKRIDLADADGPVIARTPEAFAAFLAGRYSTLEAIQALRDPWEAEQARIRQSQRRQLRRLRRGAWLWRLTHGRFRLVKL
jgi:hypothetical protein